MAHERADIAGGGEVGLEETVLRVEDAIRSARDYGRTDLFDEYDPGEFPLPNGETGIITTARRVTSASDRYAVDVSEEGKRPTTIEVLSPRDCDRPHLKFAKGDKKWSLGSAEKPPKFVRKTLGRLGVGDL